jgi:hypothetical protein
VVVLGIAVAGLAVLVAANLVFTAAVVRRLRDTEARLDDVLPAPAQGLALGERAPVFRTEDGVVSDADLTGRPALLAFFSGDCRYCPRQAELLRKHADELSGAGVAVLSVLTVADVEDPATGHENLGPVLRDAGALAVEAAPGTTMPAFGESVTPTFLRFDAGGVLVARGHDVREVLDVP